jgi:glycosyltransferase involved in cell wall biosynthesis
MLEPWAWGHHAWKKRPVWQLLERKNLASAALLHATSEQEAQSFRDRGLRVPIAIIPNGVELPGYDEPNTGHCPTSSKRTLLFLSRIHPKKGLSMLLEAWAKVRPSGWNLKIVGPDEGGHRKELEKQATSLGLADVVSFHDAVRGKDAKSALFREASLFVLPTHSENFGIAVAEAMAHGLPVITTHGAPWQLLETEQCGWWVPVSVAGLAAALDDATRQSPESLAEMGARGRAVVAERFGWDGIARQFIDCYRWLLGEGSKPDCVVQ